MSMKRVLGMMLASRMAGRGRRRGSLGTAAMLGGLGGRRRGMGGKMGMAALGYMAYRAYQDHQARTGAAGGGHAGGSAGASPQGGIGGALGGMGGGQGGIGGMIRDVADRLTGGGMSGAGQGGGMSGAGQGGAQTAAASPSSEEERAAEAFSEDEAVLLIRAMITAAYSDGALSEAERSRIMGEIETSGADPEDRRRMEREIANPRPLDELLAQVDDPETAQEFYLASRAAIDGETEPNRAYLARLRDRLGLSEAEAAEVDAVAS